MRLPFSPTHRTSSSTVLMPQKSDAFPESIMHVIRFDFLLKKDYDRFEKHPSLRTQTPPKISDLFHEVQANV